jgi:hypothetical protein
MPPEAGHRDISLEKSRDSRLGHAPAASRDESRAEAGIAFSAASPYLARTASNQRANQRIERTSPWIATVTFSVRASSRIRTIFANEPRLLHCNRKNRKARLEGAGSTIPSFKGQRGRCRGQSEPDARSATKE